MLSFLEWWAFPLLSWRKNSLSLNPPLTLFRVGLTRKSKKSPQPRKRTPWSSFFFLRTRRRANPSCTISVIGIKEKELQSGHFLLNRNLFSDEVEPLFLRSESLMHRICSCFCPLRPSISCLRRKKLSCPHTREVARFLASLTLGCPEPEGSKSTVKEPILLSCQLGRVRLLLLLQGRKPNPIVDVLVIGWG